jgi:NADH:ubiquinone oxidoreductase subunit 4 (subunit M)
MNIGQIIIITVMCILALIGYIKSNFEENENKQALWSGLTFTMFGFVVMLVVVQTQEVNKLQKQVREKCPQYEKVDSVYRLKQ